ncbi:hypothetical protein JG687_00011814 [Phytophthora cactorum]|uniref:BED-type domain-containing protein n=1 Tax=Phytophthora cactorum TaxID=29920 RepID=A0A8T1U3L2_9STRA|nr:hypothetical protein JG687_00011814 [Phytophthora cactorum]
MADNILTATHPPAAFTPRQIAGFYFKPCLDDEGKPTGYKTCKACGKYRKHSDGTEYTNLVSHVRSAHPNFEVDMTNASAAETGTLVSWVSQKTSNRYAWLRWIVMSNLPLSFCESELTRQYTNLPAVVVDTLHVNMESVTRAVEKDIGTRMPMKFGIILDGWSYGTEHFLAVCGCYETSDGPQYPLLSMPPVIQEADNNLTADSHMATIARHRLNLAVKRFLKPHEEDLEKVLMRKLRALKEAAKLRYPILKRHFRQSFGKKRGGLSTFAMLDRYVRLREFLSADDDEIADLLLSRSTHRSLQMLLEEMKDIESISKKLQSDGLTLLQARELFDRLLELKPSFAS